MSNIDKIGKHQKCLYSASGIETLVRYLGGMYKIALFVKKNDLNVYRRRMNK